MELTADVKCYYCGHISGQIIGPRGGALKISNFVPRAGYTRPAPQPGERLRCERCSGPVYCEDVTPMSIGQVSVPDIASFRRKTAAKSKARAA